MKTVKFLFLLIIGFQNISLAQWVQTSSPRGGGITDIKFYEGVGVIVSTASYNWPTGQPGGIRRTFDHGSNWQEVLNVYNSRTLEIAPNGYVYASVWDFPNPEGLYYSTNFGFTFSPLYSLGANDNIFSIIVPSQNSDTIFIGTRNGVLRSTNSGTNFNPVNNGIPANSWVRDLAYDSTGNIAAATTNGLFITTNHGSSWQQCAGIQPGDTIVKVKFEYPLSTDGSDYIRLNAGSNNGNVYGSFENSNYLLVYLSALFSEEISDFSITYLREQSIKAASTFGGTGQYSGFLKSTGNDTNYVPMNDGLPADKKISAMDGGVIDKNSNLVIFYAGTFDNTNNGGKFFYLQKTVGIQNLSNEIPASFSLEQNYPNPFNPETKIRFNIPVNSKQVKLNVYNSVGQEVAILIDEQLQQGVYEYDFNATSYPSGIYFYKLQAGEFSQTKKMILLK